MENAFGIKAIDYDEFNGFSESHNINFGKKSPLQKEKLADFIPSPSHDMSINDVITMKIDKNIFVISGGNDGFD